MISKWRTVRKYGQIRSANFRKAYIKSHVWWRSDYGSICWWSPLEFCLNYFPSFQVISEELFRNLGLAMAAVFLATIIVLANLWTCLMVFTCVGFTLVSSVKNLNLQLNLTSLNRKFRYKRQLARPRCHSFVNQQRTRQELVIWWP